MTKLKALQDVRIRLEDGKKHDVKKWQVIDVQYLDSVQFFQRHWFVLVEDKNADSPENKEKIAKVATKNKTTKNVSTK